MKCIVIYSPFAKRGRINKLKNQIEVILKEKYKVVDFAQTECAGHAVALARDACGKYDLIIAVGGDGTFSQVVCGVAEQPNKPRLAFLPAGTVNDTARSMHIPLKFKSAIEVAVNGRPIYFDVLKTNSKYGVYVLSAGICTSCTYLTKQRNKQILGFIAYFLKGFSSFFKKYCIPLKITLDNGEVHDTNFSFVLFFNSRSVAGFPINLDAELDDGKIDVLLLKNYKTGPFKSLRNSFNVLRLFMFGYKSLSKSRQIVLTQTTRAMIENPQNVEFNLDGDFGGKDDIDLSVLKNELQIMVP
ncbi:MAG: diacylglycerol kinase family protein [Clostridia bacterium]|jgi:diacylglycerol kinase (ATP)|nr:diacylglycerol kinase family lipid kinase [Clostridia bacterium]